MCVCVCVFDSSCCVQIVTNCFATGQVQLKYILPLPSH